MNLLKSAKSIIYKFDLFNSSALLRIKGEAQHTTLFGGVLSIVLMVLLFAAFANKIIDTFNKVNITSTSYTTNSDDPTPLSLSTYQNSSFMLAVQVPSYNLNNQTRAFDVVMRNSHYQYGQRLNSSVEILLQACTKEHWNGYPQIQARLDRFQVSNWMCLPKNQLIVLQGKYTSPLTKVIELSVEKCTNRSIDPRPCAPQSEVDALFTQNQGNLLFAIYFINPLINPDSNQYLTYYLEDSNYIIFSQKSGAQQRLFVQDYEIDTDQSILPVSNTMKQTGQYQKSVQLLRSLQTARPNHWKYILLALSYASLDKFDLALKYAQKCNRKKDLMRRISNYQLLMLIEVWMRVHTKIDQLEIILECIKRVNRRILNFDMFFLQIFILQLIYNYKSPNYGQVLELAWKCIKNTLEHFLQCIHYKIFFYQMQFVINFCFEKGFFKQGRAVLEASQTYFAKLKKNDYQSYFIFRKALVLRKKSRVEMSDWFGDFKQFD